jgi:hypothetical protein
MVMFALLTTQEMSDQQRQSFDDMLTLWHQEESRGGKRVDLTTPVDFDVEDDHHAAYWWSDLGTAGTGALLALVEHIKLFLSANQLGDDEAELLIGSREVDLS